MAENDIPQTNDIDEFLSKNQHQIEFFQLMRILSSHLRATSPYDVLDGFDKNNWDVNFRKYVRIRPSLSTAFPDREISSIIRNEKSQFLVETTFFGLYGVTSPLPNFYNEEINSLNDLGYDNVRKFLDVFNYSAFPLLLKAITRFRSATGLQEHLNPHQTLRKASFLGIATPALMKRFNQWPKMMEIAFVLSSPHPTSSGLRALLKNIVGSGSIQITPCASVRTPIPAANCWLLGRQASTLGEDAVVGQFVDDRRNQINVEISGQEDVDFQAILPGGSRYEYLKQSLELYVPRHLKLQFSVKSQTRSEKISESALGFGASLGSKSDMGTLVFYA